jgi:CHAP domain
MSEWWEEPYKGGPMVAVPGFPRELHVGDQDGLDAVAYKRTVWRAGRWQGPASRFDDTYSQAFSTGAGPNVIDTGIAGVQRQQGWDDTGIVTEREFNLLRSIRVPEGKPHANEMAMDATAQNLLAEAFAQFHAKPPAKATTRERALDGATSWLGYKEAPAGSNSTTFGQWYGMDRQPWCAMFATYCFEVEADGSPSFTRGSRYAYIPYIVSDAALAKHGLTLTNSPIPGDLVCYDWERDGTFDHVGLFEAGTPSSFRAIEGNTSTSNNSNGGEVMRRDRSTSHASIVFVRVAEP